ncbi:SMC domain protein [Desulfatibacillum aliphaticivorans]|uniref:SMC domain protein n=1 Tax=Desulfatibacillum aliphaticivorans TaxID=218208 RepID=B8FKF9_DESAL|nr:AAA family ATPase [Desulfatibacillum aliphaticivorans]ACL01774.1 SMC domain protein [Desulfatibacillum aliphaticivorans]
MYLSKITIENFRCFGERDKKFEMSLKPGLTTLVGENDAGKSAIIDAIRYVLCTTDQEWLRIKENDFHVGANPKEIRIVCKFDDLEAHHQRAFIEYLTHDASGAKPPVFFLHWTAKETGEIMKGRPYRRIELHSGEKGEGPSIDPKVRELLSVTYLRPLRDAERALSAGRGSRLSQVLYHTEEVKSSGKPYGEGVANEELSVTGIGELADALIKNQPGIVETRKQIDNHLEKLTLLGNPICSKVEVSGAAASPDVRLRQLLEKLDLSLDEIGKPGLGSNNLLFMACELLLLAQENEGNRMLLIEEPEAHLHPQRQLQVMKTLQEEAEEKKIQIIVTTHSPNLASAIKLKGLTLIHENKAFSMAEGETKLEKSDYQFLERFLDVTKANLFFARGVMIVEGDAENILIPTLAKLIGRDFTENGVSIVNVGGVGLRRYARIFQRVHIEKDGLLKIPVACVTDLDVMPNCAPAIIDKLDKEGHVPEIKKRQWRMKHDYNEEKPLEQKYFSTEQKATGQCVRTFVSDEWTMEYNLAIGPQDDNGEFPGGLGYQTFAAAYLASKDDSLYTNKKTTSQWQEEIKKNYKKIILESEAQDGCLVEEVIASKIYNFFVNKKASKTIAAQHLSYILQLHVQRGDLSEDQLRAVLPTYLVEAIEYVTGNLILEIKDGKEGHDGE